MPRKNPTDLFDAAVNALDGEPVKLNKLARNGKPDDPCDSKGHDWRNHAGQGAYCTRCGAASSVSGVNDHPTLASCIRGDK